MTITVIINGVSYEIANDMIEIVDTFGTDAAAALNTFVEKVEESQKDNEAAKVEAEMNGQIKMIEANAARNGFAAGSRGIYENEGFTLDARVFRQFTDPAYIYSVRDCYFYDLSIFYNFMGNILKVEKVEFRRIGNYVHAVMFDQLGREYPGMTTLKSVYDHAKNLDVDMEWKDYRIDQHARKTANIKVVVA